jgi:TPR repeat protein
LALSLAQGHGIPKDPSKAIELPQHSAEQGYLPAQLDLALGLETA